MDGSVDPQTEVESQFAMVLKLDQDDVKEIRRNMVIWGQHTGPLTKPEPRWVDVAVLGELVPDEFDGVFYGAAMTQRIEIPVPVCSRCLDGVVDSHMSFNGKCEV
jgi:hypothetical protein